MVSKLRATDSRCDSDQEDPSEGGAEEQERVRGDKAEVLQAASVIFADAAEEFSTVGAVATRMEEWKRKQPRSYQDTYVSLSLLKVFLPFVRLEALGWHPSDRCAEALAKQRWFAALESYGMGDGEVAADDADLDLIPKLVEKGLLPRLKEWLRSGWDPLSRGSTACSSPAALPRAHDANRGALLCCPVKYRVNFDLAQLFTFAIKLLYDGRQAAKHEALDCQPGGPRP